MMSKPDMRITVGHIIENPTFDTEFAFRVPEQVG